jgi:hypothetical protein
MYKESRCNTRIAWILDFRWSWVTVGGSIRGLRRGLTKAYLNHDFHERFRIRKVLVWLRVAHEER